MFVLVMVLHVLSPFAALNAVAPRAGITVERDIAYAPGDRHTLDVYVPARGSAAAPVVVFFYGGGWETGDKATYRYVGAALAAQGVLAIIPDYRLHPAVQFPAFMQDAALAVAWARAHAARFGGDEGRLFLMGHSAGAHIATLLALDPAYLRAAGMEPAQDVCGVIGLAGLYDFSPAANAGLRAVFGPESEWPRTQPVNYVTPQAPRMLLLAGSADRTVDPANTLRLAGRLGDAGAAVHAELAPGLSHRAIVVALAAQLSFLSPVLQETLRFVRAPDCR